MTADHVEQAVDHLRRDGVPVRRRPDARPSETVGHLDDEVPLVRAGRPLADPRAGGWRALVCLVFGHRYDGRQRMHWPDEQTPAIECTRCGLIRARPPTGGTVEGEDGESMPERPDDDPR